MELELEPLCLPCDKKRPIVIAGPCSAETEEQVMSTARMLADKGCHIRRMEATYQARRIRRKWRESLTLVERSQGGDWDDDLYRGGNPRSCRVSNAV